MEFPLLGCWHRMRRLRPFLALLVIGVMIFVGGIAYASSEGSGSGHGESSSSKGWIATDTYRVINFSILAIVLVVLMRKPIAQALGSRAKGIEDELNDLDEKKAAVEEKLKEYTEKLARLDDEAEEMLLAYSRQGEEAKIRILQEAEKAAEKLEQQAQRTIENEFKKAKQKLHHELLDKALVKAEERVAGSMTDKDQGRLVDEYLIKVVG